MRHMGIGAIADHQRNAIVGDGRSHHDAGQENGGNDKTRASMHRPLLPET
jgi:hypothetical protein